MKKLSYKSLLAKSHASRVLVYQEKTLGPRATTSCTESASASYVNMAESEGAAASEVSEQTSEEMSLKAVVIGGTGAVGRCLLGDLLSSKVMGKFSCI